MYVRLFATYLLVPHFNYVFVVVIESKVAVEKRKQSVQVTRVEISAAILNPQNLFGLSC